MAFWGHFNADQFVYDITNKSQPYVIRKMHRNHKLIKKKKKIIPANYCRERAICHAVVFHSKVSQLWGRARLSSKLHVRVCVLTDARSLRALIVHTCSRYRECMPTHMQCIFYCETHQCKRLLDPHLTSGFSLPFFFFFVSLSLSRPHGVKQPSIWAPPGEEDIDWYISGIDYTLH